MSDHQVQFRDTINELDRQVQVLKCLYESSQAPMTRMPKPSWLRIGDFAMRYGPASCASLENLAHIINDHEIGVHCTIHPTDQVKLVLVNDQSEDVLVEVSADLGLFLGWQTEFTLKKINTPE